MTGYPYDHGYDTIVVQRTLHDLRTRAEMERRARSLSRERTARLVVGRLLIALGERLAPRAVVPTTEALVAAEQVPTLDKAA